MSAPEIVLNLVRKFREGYDGYVGRSSRFNETEARVQFINPFFEALGWDVTNRNGALPGFQEVIHEDAVHVEGRAKAPDYSFRINGKRLFFLEAKKPSIILEKGSDADRAALQTRRYGYSAGLSLSILTDFHEFAVYDTTIRPKPADKSHVGRILFLKFDEYPERYREIEEVFSRAACVSGRIHSFAREKTQYKGTSPLDRDFLSDLESWRLTLARNIALRNNDLSAEQLSRSVQLIMDRLLFLRVAEDRGLERFNRLLECSNHTNQYQELFKYFSDADDKYNSGLFHFKKEYGRNSEIDTLTPRLHIDTSVLSRIIGGLYPPESPYEFSAITSDILGIAYEQFLGSVITLTKGHRASVVQKPEVRHAGGVYYTPKYIVDFIVENTLAEQLRKTTPKLAKIRILDPACGSGSFLISAYEYLMKWAFDWYVKHDPAKHPHAVYFPRGADRTEGSWRLTIAEKKRLLLNHIFGVDIDQNAVEVTKLNLMLKALEDENSATVNHAVVARRKDSATQSLGLRERILPDLVHNIQCGNSLVSIDYYDGRLPETIEDNERRRINAFDFDQAFGSSQGFDVIIGNPPYVRQEILGEDFKKYAKKTYRTFAGTADLYTYFIEKSFSLLSPHGIYSVIVANKWMRANYGEKLRRFLMEKNIEHIIDFGDLQVFKGATTYPCILKASNSAPGNIDVCNVRSLEFANLQEEFDSSKFKVEHKYLSPTGWSLVRKAEAELLAKIKSAGIPLGEYVNGKIYRGVLTGLNEAFVIDSRTRDRLIAEDKRSAEVIKPFLIGRDIKRYKPLHPSRYVIFTRRGVNIKQYPAIEKYLTQFKPKLMPKPVGYTGPRWIGRKPGSYKWYEIQDSVDYYQEFEKDKIIYPNILMKPEFAFDVDGIYTNQKCFIITTDDKYLLGLLNSELFRYLYKHFLPKLRGNFFEPSYIFFKNFPIRHIEESERSNLRDVKSSLINLVNSMLLLNQKLAAARLEGQSATHITHLQRQIDSLDRNIVSLKARPGWER